MSVRSEIRELGVGINTLPHAIKELADLGLLEALDDVAIRTYELIYQNRLGQEVWRDLRGLGCRVLIFLSSRYTAAACRGFCTRSVLDRLGA